MSEGEPLLRRVSVPENARWYASASPSRRPSARRVSGCRERLSMPSSASGVTARAPAVAGAGGGAGEGSAGVAGSAGAAAGAVGGAAAGGVAGAASAEGVAAGAAPVAGGAALGAGSSASAGAAVKRTDASATSVAMLPRHRAGEEPRRDDDRMAVHCAAVVPCMSSADLNARGPNSARNRALCLGRCATGPGVRARGRRSEHLLRLLLGATSWARRACAARPRRSAPTYRRR